MKQNQKGIDPSFIHFWLFRKIKLRAIFENIWLQERINNFFKKLQKLLIF